MTDNNSNQQEVKKVSDSSAADVRDDSSIFLNKPVKESMKKLTPQGVILSLCRAKNWRLSDLAREIGYSRQAVNNYLHGFWAIPTRIKVKIAEALEVDSSVIWDLEK